MNEEKKTWFEFVCDDIATAVAQGGLPNTSNFHRNLENDDGTPKQATRRKHTNVYINWCIPDDGPMDPDMATKVAEHIRKELQNSVAADGFITAYLERITTDPSFVQDRSSSYRGEPINAAKTNSPVSKLFLQVHTIASPELRVKVVNLINALSDIEDKQIEESNARIAKQIAELQRQLELNNDKLGIVAHNRNVHTKRVMQFGL